VPASRALGEGTGRDLLLLLSFSALLFTVALGARDLWNPNEPLYGRAVVEMSRSGDWSLPTFNGRVFDEKPILYFWLALGASALRGTVDEWSLRLPSALAGVVGVALVYLLVRPYAGRSRARLAALAFATTEIVFWSARSVQMDLLLAVTTLAAVLAVSRVIDHGASPVRGAGLAGLAAGLGVLAKGPLGVVCPVLALAAYCAVRPGGARDVASAARERGAWAAGLASFALVACPWFLWLALRGEAHALHELLLRQNVTRFVAAWDHAQPWWYYLVYLWIDMAPWALLLPLAVGLRRASPDALRLDRLAAAWLISTVVFFSLSSSKRSPYLLPVAPAVAILASAPIERWLARALDAHRKRVLEVLVGLAGATLAACGALLAIRGIERYPSLVPPGRALAVLLVAGGLAVVLLATAPLRRPRAAAAVLAATLVALYLLAALWVLPAADSFKSARPFCERLVGTVPAASSLRSYRPWKWRASYVYYADRAIPSIDSPQELERYWAESEEVFLLVERDRLDEVQRLLGPLEPRIDRAVGGNAVYLFSNRPSKPPGSP
jgi:4-amino-4-deoxy-L-arabinose transferase-like glycosyltransferase